MSIPYELNAVVPEVSSQTRVIFNTKVVGLTESRIQSYWAQMKFTGRFTQPKEVQSEQEMLVYLRNNKGSIGYLTADTNIPQGLHIMFSSE